MGKVLTKEFIDENSKDPLVFTPGGPRPKSKVHLIRSGEHIDVSEGIAKRIDSKSGIVLSEYGLMRENHDKAPPNQNRSKEKISHALTPDPLTGWIIYSEWQKSSGSSISYFSTTWLVPTNPKSDNGQLIYIFNGLVPSTYDFILQPVLQWGVSPAGGGSYWAVANWFVGSGTSPALHSDLIRVKTGDQLQGIMTLTAQNAGKFSYLSSFQNFSNIDLKVENTDELIHAYQTLECYGLKKFTDYPEGTCQMDNIEIIQGGSQATINWIPHNDITDNGQTCTIINNSSPGGRVDLHFSDLDVIVGPSQVYAGLTYQFSCPKMQLPGTGYWIGFEIVLRNSAREKIAVVKCEQFPFVANIPFPSGKTGDADIYLVLRPQLHVLAQSMIKIS